MQELMSRLQGFVVPMKNSGWTRYYNNNNSPIVAIVLRNTKFAKRKYISLVRAAC